MRRSAPVVQLDSRAVKELMEARAEGEYVLIDVRERQEYEDAHIPGARNIPLLSLLTAPESVPLAPHTIFYCRSGNRSLRAARHLARLRDTGTLYNLDGGILGWSGNIVPDMPPLRLFDTDGSIESLLMRALELEKGAHTLYQRLIERAKDEAVRRTLERVFDHEDDHAYSVYEQLVAHTRVTETFEEIFARLPSDMLESGHSLDEALNAIEAADGVDEALLEIALEVEVNALDLYRAVADAVPDGPARHAFLRLADEEKHHAEVLTKALGQRAGR